ncbi:flagellar export protein FliJ [Halomonas nitroreducens]|uniref:Flagellar FliJ protein n=1 Tax=Halomonas nitroreducens TaxID=447425 RepID=A0A3S0HTR7_9GAMM|nr:flagellar export protein FliJ [Halomonas nitroreducens]RTR04401.1 flagellar export protein FliJ [Halomonas nitroreducens]
MSRTPLDNLTELAREARDQAGQRLAGERRTAAQIIDQLESLQRYRQEYAQKLQAAMRAGIDPASMHNYQRFLASLDDALERARQALAAQQQRVDQSQRHWRQEQRKLSSYDTLAERRAQAQRRAEQRREQRVNDDLVTGRWLRQNAARGER